MVVICTVNFYRNSDGRFSGTDSCQFPLVELEDLDIIQEFMEEWHQDYADARNYTRDVFIEKITHEEWV